jgi:predicted transcriptional regulator
MNTEDKVDLKKITDPSEKKILKFLKQEGTCIYGEIIRNLQLPTTKGQEAIYSLMNKGFIKHKDKSSFIELNVEIG